MINELFLNTNIDVSKFDIIDYPANKIIFLEGEQITKIGFVITGKLIISTYSFTGNEYIIQELNSGSLFGDIVTLSNTFELKGNVITTKKTTVMYLDFTMFKQLLTINQVFLFNYLNLISKRVLSLNLRIKLLSKTTIRDKIITYLNTKRKETKTKKIKLDLSKEKIALLLGVKRPSLSRELINMKKEGLIDYDLHTITILYKS